MSGGWHSPLKQANSDEAQEMNAFFSLLITILLPGLFGILVLRNMIGRKPWPPFLYALYIVAFGAAVYAVEQLALTAYQYASQYGEDNPSFSVLSVWGIFGAQISDKALKEIGWGLLIAAPLAVFSAWVINKKFVTKVAHFLKVSTQYGDESLYSHFLGEVAGEWVYVRDVGNDLSYQGWVYAYTETAEIQELVLADVTVYGHKDPDRLKYPLPYAYLAKGQGQFVIEVVPLDELGGSRDGEEEVVH